MIGRTAVVRSASKQVAKRNFAEAPRMHKAKDTWAEIQATRPVDPHPHNVFHPPYNKVTVGLGVVAVVATGYGAMYAGVRHQQFKQGYWK